MNAIRIDRLGGPEVLQLSDVPTPKPAAGEALVRHSASGVNFIDTYLRTGLYKRDLPFIVGATKAANERGVKAGDLVKTISGYVDGKGGGKPDMAQGSGARPDGLQAAFDALRDELAAH